MINKKSHLFVSPGTTLPSIAGVHSTEYLNTTHNYYYVLLLHYIHGYFLLAHALIRSRPQLLNQLASKQKKPDHQP